MNHEEATGAAVNDGCDPNSDDMRALRVLFMARATYSAYGPEMTSLPRVIHLNLTSFLYGPMWVLTQALAASWLVAMFCKSFVSGSDCDGEF